jgi:hypothetical protein
MIYELREYLAADGRGADLHRRFADHTLALFDRHDIPVAGYWTDQENPDRIIYLLRFPDKESRDRAWTAFGDDPEWQSVKQASETDGPITARVNSTLLVNPDYWRSDTVRGASRAAR